MRERDTDLLIQMANDMGEVKATVISLKDDHVWLREAVVKNSTDISEVKSEVAIAKGQKRALKWALASVVAIAGIFGFDSGSP